MKEFIHFIRTLRKGLLILFIGSVIITLLINLLLINTPLYYDGGEKFWQLVDRLCLAYISAYIFYVLVVHIKAEKDKLNLRGYIDNKVIGIIRICWGLIDELTKTTGIKIKDRYPDDTELTCILKKLNPNGKAPLLLDRLDNYANWVQYLDYCKRRTNDAIQKMFVNMPFLETEFVNHLVSIEDCIHYKVMNHLIFTMPIGNSDMTAFKSEIKDYFDLISKLQKYSEKKLSIKLLNVS